MIKHALNFIVLIGLLYPIEASALIKQYSAKGQASIIDLQTSSEIFVSISGYFNIDYIDPPEDINSIESFQYVIESFSLSIGEYNFEGYGDILMTPTDHYLQLYGSSGDWDEWLFDREEDCRDYGYLIADLENYDHGFNYKALKSDPSKIIATPDLQIEYTPVPEPSVYISLCLGFFILVIMKKKMSFE